MPARQRFTQRLSIAIVAVFIATMVIALAFATQPVDAKPGNGNPNPHKYTATPTPDLTGTFFAGGTQTEIFRLTNQPAWTETGAAQVTAIFGTQTAAVQQTETAAAQTPTP